MLVANDFCYSTIRLLQDRSSKADSTSCLIKIDRTERMIPWTLLRRYNRNSATNGLTSDFSLPTIRVRALSHFNSAIPIDVPFRYGCVTNEYIKCGVHRHC